MSKKSDFRESLTFYERLGSDADVRLEPGLQQDEIFDDQFERRAREIQRTPGQDNVVAVVPRKRGPWTGNNQLGNERPFSDNEGNLQTILRLDEWDLPQVWSVALIMKLTDPSFVGFKVRALIEAGAGGIVTPFEMDWNQGSTFSFPFNAINIVAQYSNTQDLPSDLRLGVQIGKRPLAGACPTWTSELLDNNEVIVIPRFAKRVFLNTVANAPGFVATVALEFRTGGGSGGANGRVTGDQLLTLGGWYPIPGGSNTVTFTNGGGGLAPVCNLIFELGLGS